MSYSDLPVTGGELGHVESDMKSPLRGTDSRVKREFTGTDAPNGNQGFYLED